MVSTPLFGVQRKLTSSQLKNRKINYDSWYKFYSTGKNHFRIFKNKVKDQKVVKSGAHHSMINYPNKDLCELMICRTLCLLLMINRTSCKCAHYGHIYYVSPLTWASRFAKPFEWSCFHNNGGFSLVLVIS